MPVTIPINAQDPEDIPLEWYRQVSESLYALSQAGSASGGTTSVSLGRDGLSITDHSIRWFLAEITGESSGAYAWRRLVSTTSGTNSVDGYGTAGTTTALPAYEVNNRTGIASGTVVLMWAADSNAEMRFVVSSSTELRGLTFTADTGSTADSDPGDGKIRWNNATHSSATTIYFDNQTADAVSVATYWAALPQAGFLYLQQADNSARWQKWKWTAIVDGTGYRKFTVTSMGISTDPIEDGKLVLTMFSAGGFSVQEVDGSPSTATVLKFPNTSLTDNGDGTATVKSASATETGLVNTTTQQLAGEKEFLNTASFTYTTGASALAIVTEKVNVYNSGSATGDGGICIGATTTPPNGTWNGIVNTGSTGGAAFLSGSKLAFDIDITATEGDEFGTYISGGGGSAPEDFHIKVYGPDAPASSTAALSAHLFITGEPQIGDEVVTGILRESGGSIIWRVGDTPDNHLDTHVYAIPGAYGTTQGSYSRTTSFFGSRSTLSHDWVAAGDVLSGTFTVLTHIDGVLGSALAIGCQSCTFVQNTGGIDLATIAASGASMGFNVFEGSTLRAGDSGALGPGAMVYGGIVYDVGSGTFFDGDAANLTGTLDLGTW